MLNALGSAGTQSAGLWEFLRTAADSKQLHTAKAAADGITAAYLAQEGFTGARHILEGPQGMAAGMSTDADPSRLCDRLGERWALAETSFKFHASCRHTHPAADALQQALRDNNLTEADIERVVAHVHQGAIDVLGPVVNPQTVHQSKFSMGTVLALIARQGRAGLAEFDAGLDDPGVATFRCRVEMELDPEVDGAYPQRWIGKVTVYTRDGRKLHSRVDEPKGDPGNTLSRAEIEDKTLSLGRYAGAATEAELRGLIDAIWGLEKQERIGAPAAARRLRTRGPRHRRRGPRARPPATLPRRRRRPLASGRAGVLYPPLAAKRLPARHLRCSSSAGFRDRCSAVGTATPISA